MTGIDFLHNPAIKYIFECFSNSVGLHLKAVDLSGETILRFHNIHECAFCRQVQESQMQKCKASYGMAAQEAAKWKEPYFFRCHAGLVMWAVPLIEHGHCFGSMICGQILLWAVDDIFIDELQTLNPQIPDFNRLCENARKLNVLSADKAQSITDILSAVVSYVLNAAPEAEAAFQENKRWSDTVLAHMENRKKQVLKDPLDAYRYMLSEKRLIQQVRTGEKERTMQLLPLLLSDMYMLSSYSLDRTKIRCLELMAQISRAVCEAGLDNHIALEKNEQLHGQISRAESFETLFSLIARSVGEYLDALYLLGDLSHRSILKRVRTYINEHFQETLTIDKIARYAGFSQSYLRHIFKANYYCTVSDYITRVRIENALILMRQPELTLQEVAFRCGFKSASHFTKVFQRQMGVAPRQYRSEYFS